MAETWEQLAEGRKKLIAHRLSEDDGVADHSKQNGAS
jgi:hypothetical protein